MNSETDQSSAESEEEKRIKDYLVSHPEFFSRHPDLLEVLALPHDSGKAVSLVERQVSVLRDRNAEMRQRLNSLLESARVNDKLFEKTKRLVLSLIEADSLNEVVEVLYTSLGKDYDIEFFSLVLLSSDIRQSLCQARVVGQDEAHNQIGTLLRTHRAICGVLRPEELHFLFGDQARDIGSVAAVTLHQGSTFGILAIGNRDPNHYRSSMGTLFLSYIADVLNRVIPRFI